jgi:molecular chaperone GrpE
MPDTDQTPDEAPADVGLQAKLDQLEQQVADYKLLLADYQNSAKRLKDDADRQRKYAAEPFARDVLTALDSLELAAQAARDLGDNGPLAKGVAAAVNLFLDALKRHGVTRIDVAPGAALDPTVHQAVMAQPTNDYPPGTVASVMQSGYRLHDRVLRPASVIVASEPPAGGE